jgi:carbon storage regulator
MLVLTRKLGQSIRIGGSIRIQVVEVRGNQIRLGIEAPAEVRVLREELYQQVSEENEKAQLADRDKLEGVSGVWTDLRKKK